MATNADDMAGGPTNNALDGGDIITTATNDIHEQITMIEDAQAVVDKLGSKWTIDIRVQPFARGLATQAILRVKKALAKKGTKTAVTMEQEIEDIETEEKIPGLLDDIERLEDYQITVVQVKKTFLKEVLVVLKAEKSKLSRVTRDRASDLFDMFERKEWGALVAVDDEGDLEPDVGADVGGIKTEGMVRKRKPTTTAGGLGFAHGAAERPLRSLLQRPPADHPIYGERGIMRKVLFDRSGKSASYKFDPLSVHARANTFGHNKIRVGQWWPRQICALRDGAHGASQGGIYAVEGFGVYSIVIANTYADLDTDDLPTLWYSGSNSIENTDPSFPTENRNLRAMRLTKAKKNLIRVLRAATKKGHGPIVGLRYDGLYRIVDEEIRKNKAGGAYVAFKLDRFGNQDPVNSTHPTDEEVLEEEAIKKGY